MCSQMLVWSPAEAVASFDMWIMDLGKVLHLEGICFIKEKKEHVFLSIIY